MNARLVKQVHDYHNGFKDKFEGAKHKLGIAVNEYGERVGANGHEIMDEGVINKVVM